MKLRDIIDEFSEKSVQENNASKVNLAYMHYNAAVNCIKHDKLDDAKKELKEAVKEYPKFYDGFLLLALVIFSNGSRIESIRTINMISDRDIHAKAMKYYDILSDENATKEDLAKVSVVTPTEKNTSTEPIVDNEVHEAFESPVKLEKFQSDFEKRFKTAKKSVSGVNAVGFDFGDEFSEFIDDEVEEISLNEEKAEESVENVNEEPEEGGLFDEECETSDNFELPEVPTKEEPVEEEPAEEEQVSDDKIEEEQTPIIIPEAVEEKPQETVFEQRNEVGEDSQNEPFCEIEIQNVTNASKLADKEEKKDGFVITLFKKKSVLLVCIIVICLIALAAVVLISTKLHKSIEDNTPTKAPVTEAPVTPYVTNTPSPTETPVNETLAPTEVPTDTPTAVPTEEPTPSPTREPSDDQKAANATIAYNKLKNLYAEQKYYECAALIKSTDFSYLPERLVEENNKLKENALNAFGKQYHGKTFDAVNKENWNDVIKYAKPLISLYPEWEKISSIYFHLGKAYEFTGDKDSAKKYYNSTIELFPGTKDAEHASYRLSLIK